MVKPHHISMRPTVEDQKRLRFAEMDAAYKKQLKALKALVRAGRINFHNIKRP
jgi:hypothetical protein